MKGLPEICCGAVALLVLGTEATAQTTPGSGWAVVQDRAAVRTNRNGRPARQRPAAVTPAPTTFADPFAASTAPQTPSFQLDREAAFSAPTAKDFERDFGPAVDFQSETPVASANPATRFDGLAATSRSDVWFESAGHSDRMRLTTRGTLRRADGAPLPVTLQDRAEFDAQGYDVSYTRGWPVARGYTASGLEVTLIPHAGFGVGDEGGSAEAGATLKIGDSLDRLAPDGRQRFGDRARWYLYAAGSGRAVGYNFARTRDGDYARSGISQDKGSFLGDASIGVAYRRGAMQGSFGVVYREIKAEGLNTGPGIDNDVSEGLVAFQLSIRPQW